MGLSLAEVRNKGWKALIKKLEHTDAIKFILLYEAGKRNCVEERKELFKGTSVEDIVAEIRREKGLR